MQNLTVKRLGLYHLPGSQVMSRASPAVPYKELQKEAKKYGIPANMKRSFLKSAIDAFIKNDVVELNTIIEYHRNQRKRRNSKIEEECAKSKKTRVKKDNFVLSPGYSSALNKLRERPFFEVNRSDNDDDDDDDDVAVAAAAAADRYDNSNGFHPESTSTPNHHHSSELKDRYSDDALRRGSIPISNYSSFSKLNNNARVPCSLPIENRSKSTATFISVVDAAQSCIINSEYPSFGFPNVPQLNDVRAYSSAAFDAAAINDGARSRTPSMPEECDTSAILRIFENANLNAYAVDAGSMSAEVDSNSDTETLSLSDEIAYCFDSQTENERVSLALSNFFAVHSRCGHSSDGELLFAENLPSYENDYEMTNFNRTCYDYDNKQLDMTNVTTSADATRPSEAYNLLPSINTLLPEYRAQLYSQETISFQGSRNGDKSLQKDYYCNSLEIKMNERATDKDFAKSNFCQSCGSATIASRNGCNSRNTSGNHGGDDANATSWLTVSVSAADGSATASIRFNDNDNANANAAALFVPAPSPAYRLCKYEVYGCNVMLVTNSAHQEYAETHEKECLFRVVGCPSSDTSCNWCGSVSTLTDHVYLCHKSDLNIGGDLLYKIYRHENQDLPFITYFQLHEGIIFVVTLHINGKKCVATMQYLPEIETTDYRNRRIRGTMQLVYFTTKVESKCWSGIVRPYSYFENAPTAYENDDILQSAIGNSKNIAIRVLID